MAKVARKSFAGRNAYGRSLMWQRTNLNPTKASSSPGAWHVPTRRAP